MNTFEEVQALTKKHDDEAARANFQLFAKGENWWTFRRRPDTFEESFTVSFLQDGTVVLTGDYGFLAFQRTWYPQDLNVLKGFPNSDTNIYYFIEKIKACGVGLGVMEWDRERAVKEIESELIRAKCSPAKLNDALDMHFYSEEDMLHQIERLRGYLGEIQEQNFGKHISEWIFWQFSLLKIWGNFTRQEELNK